MTRNTKQKKSLFDRIAPVYGLFYPYQKKHYNEVLDQIEKKFDLSSFHTVIDVGSGTGALCSVLNQRGYSVTGVEPAKKMLEVGAAKKENRTVQFLQANAISGLPFADETFDVSFATYVAHGLKREERKALYKEMGRITKDYVILQDYNENRGLLTNVVEWMEGGDYFYFIKHVKEELKESFRQVMIIDVGPKAAWYICSK